MIKRRKRKSCSWSSTFLREKNRLLGGCGRDRTVLCRTLYSCDERFYCSL